MHKKKRKRKRKRKRKKGKRTPLLVLGIEDIYAQLRN
jgi:ribosomal protein L21